MDVAGLVRDARAVAGLTQRELAERAGTSQPAIARYERGGAVPTLATLERMLHACGRRPVVFAVAADDTGRRLGPAARVLRRERRRLLAAARRRGVRNLRVFGSVARGEDHSGSDVDLLVELEPGRTLLDLAAFRREAAEMVGASVDVATADMLKERIRPQVMSESLPL